MKKKTYASILAVILVLALMFSLAACNKTAENPAASEPPAAPASSAAPANPPPATNPDTPAAPGEAPANDAPAPTLTETPLRIAWLTPYSTIDPHYIASDTDYALSELLFESFYDIDQLGNEFPRLAESYDVSDDGLTWTYHLRRGVTWQTGGDFTSADVLYSITRAQESPYVMGYLAMVEDVQAPDDFTVVFTLAGLDPAFHIELSRIRFLSEAATKNFEFGFSDGIPGGTGPYTLVSMVMDQKAVVTRNENYYGDPAPIGNIEVIIFSDTNASVRAMEAGECDYVVADADNWERLKATGKYNTYTEDTISVRFFTMNNECAPFDDPLVRQAINYAVNKDDMIYGSAGGYGVPAAYLANPNMNTAAPQFDEIFQYSYDPGMAVQLLEEAGYPNGLTISEPIKTAATDEFAIPAQILKEQLAAVGIQIEISTVDMDTYVMDLILGNFGIGILSIGLEPDASLVAYAYVTDGIEYLNLSRYSNERVDELFALGGSTLDLEARKAYYREAFDIASREAAYLPLFVFQATIVTTPGLHSTSYRNFYYWYWD